MLRCLEEEWVVEECRALAIHKRRYFPHKCRHVTNAGIEHGPHELISYRLVAHRVRNQSAAHPKQHRSIVHIEDVRSDRDVSGVGDLHSSFQRIPGHFLRCAQIVVLTQLDPVHASIDVRLRHCRGFGRVLTEHDASCKE